MRSTSEYLTIQCALRCRMASPKRFLYVSFVCTFNFAPLCASFEHSPQARSLVNWLFDEHLLTMWIMKEPKTTTQPQPPSGGVGIGSISISHCPFDLPFPLFGCCCCDFLRAGGPCTIFVSCAVLYGMWNVECGACSCPWALLHSATCVYVCVRSRNFPIWAAISTAAACCAGLENNLN